MRQIIIVIGTVSLALALALFGWQGVSSSTETESSYDDINVALRMAVREADHAEVTTLLAQGADPNADFYGQTPLLLAIRWGDLELVKTLVEGGADIHKPGFFGGSLLAATTWESNYDMAVYLLEQGADVNTADESGWTPLHRAVTHAGVNITRLFLDRGADVSATTEHGDTPLSLFTADLTPEVVQLLIDYGSDINHSKGIFGNTPLHEAITNISVMQVLLDNGADINANNDSGDTPLHEAISNLVSGSIPESPDDTEEVIRFLLASGADIEAKNEWGYTPLLGCKFDGGTGIFELLLEHGADINAQGAGGNSLLHTVYWNEDQNELAAYLVRLGADIDLKNIMGDTPVYSAAARRNTGMVEILLDAGAHYDIVIAAGLGNLEYIQETLVKANRSSADEALEKKALSLAVNTGHLDVVDYLLGLGVETRLVDMIKIGYFDEVQRLIDQGVEVNEDALTGESPLYEAGKAGNNEIIKLLVDSGADLTTRDFLDSAISRDHFDSYKLLLELGAHHNNSSKWGMTALQRAITKEVKYVELLLEKGVDVNEPSGDLTTPLHTAVYYGNVETAKLLIAAGANLDAQNEMGWTPLTSAISGMSGDSTDCLEALLAAGADPDIPEHLGFTPVLYGIMMGQIKDIELLLNFGADLEYTTDYGYTALASALSSGQDEIVAILRKHGAIEPSIEMLWEIEHQEQPGS